MGNVGPLELLIALGVFFMLLVIAFAAGYFAGKARGYRLATIDAKKA